MENKYNRSKVYKLQDNINFYFYIGSTCNELRKRLQQHKVMSKIEKNRKVYSYFNSIGWENVKIILIQEFNLENRHQLLREEDKVIQIYLQDQKCLNVKRPFYGLEPKEQKEVYRKTNKEHLKEADKKYRAENYEQISIKQKQYRDKNKEMFSEYKKNWYENNKSEILEKRKIQYEQNKTEITTCTCGKLIKTIRLKRHLKSKKHLNFEAKQITNE